MDDRRTTWVLIFVELSLLLLMLAQAPATGGQGSLLEALSLRAVAPVAQLVAGGARGVGGVRENLKLRSSLQGENERLRRENQQLRLDLLQLQDVQGRLDRLTQELAYGPLPAGRLQLADVAYIDYRSPVRMLLVYAPEARLRKNQPVLTARGLVGRVVLVSEPYAKVQLIIDHASSVGAMIQRTRRQGLVRGTGSGGLEVAYLPRQTDVRPGDLLLTSGIDGVFPRGVPVGTVASVSEGSDLFHRIRLEPATSFSSLDQVFIVDREPIPDELRTSPAR